MAMIIIYNGKKKGSANKLFMNKLYAKDFTVIDDEDYADDTLYDNDEPETDLGDDTNFEPVSEIDEIIENNENL